MSDDDTQEHCDNCFVPVDKDPTVLCDDCDGTNSRITGRIVRATDSFIVAVAAVAELTALPYVWQALPMGVDKYIDTRSPEWERQRVLVGPVEDE